ncbi:Endonuclease/exonuclease/phosphatase [Amylostereum chailletii]|nr:Endonuclease/exonuclease/phosphatase [Amylostereum chailletii]
MRILSWNINGVRTVPQYHPWNGFKTWDGVLRELQADIICFQEMKTTRAAIGRNFALPDSFDSFFSFPVSRGGYSGVAVYTDPSTALPLKAEEGLSGTLQPKPAPSSEERVSSSYPTAHELDLVPDEDGGTPSDFSALDAEGRGLVLDFGLFVLINLYCPNETSDARLPFKMNYHLMLQERVRHLVEVEHREVIVLGDINICASPIDHCDGHLPSNAATFYEHPARAWLKRWLAPEGLMVDVVRKFWPDRRGMYTCWNTKIGARETNYGTRIDYFLVTPGLLPWIKHGDIQQSVKGSDHCPIYIDLHDEITLESGATLKLRDVMKMGEGRKDPPRIAAKFWTELQGKQTLMSSFFTKRDAPAAVKPTDVEMPPLDKAQLFLATTIDRPDAERAEDSRTTEPPSSQTSVAPISEPADSALIPFSSSPGPSAFSRPPSPPPAGFRPSQTSRKRLRPDDTSSTNAKSKKVRAGQSKLSSFFAKPSPSSSIPVDTVDPSDDQASSSQSRIQDKVDADHRLACELSASQETELMEQSEPVASQGKSQETTQNKDAWSTLFTPLKPPICAVHGEPTKEFRVNKPGPNKGKVFYVCARPVGPGYDKGRGERLREEVDHRYKCNFFKWASDVKKEASRTAAGSYKKS